ncbi:MAG TPA: YidC/Oxa1 family membrane protein insertase [Candidatus Magasanikbacteria bacterium]|nr:YidC/Oxa1 family membrane protein insertase [Candidatus Magasanikbacteria bacterium]
MSGLFHTFLYQPLFNIFVGLYNLIPDVGVGILLITIIVKAILYPLNSSSIKAQKSLSDMQPKIDALKAKYKDEKQKIAEETMKLYKENKINPMASCLPLLVQLPIFIALYWVLRDGLSTNNFDTLYSFVKNPGSINTVTLGLVDLKNNSLILAIFAGAAQFWQAKSMMRKKAPVEAGAGAKDENMMSMMNKQMLYLMPVMTVLIGMKLPGGLSLYWFLSTALMALQQMLVMRTPSAGGPTAPTAIEGKIVK